MKSQIPINPTPDHVEASPSAVSLNDRDFLIERKHVTHPNLILI